MEIIKPPVVKFMKRFDRVEPAIIDSSAAQTFKRCPMQYFYRYVLGRDAKTTPPYFRFGSSIHKFMEVLEKQQKFTAALTAAQELFNKHGGDPVVGSQYDYLTEMRLLKSCQVLYDKWKNEKLQKAIEVTSTEQYFNVELADGTHRAGRLDQSIRWNGKPWVRDYKTTSKMGKFYERTLEPNDQFSCYSFALSKLSGDRVQGVVVEVVYNTKKEGPEVHRFLATRTDTQLERWQQDQLFWNAFLASCRENDTWPLNENACYNCQFHSVCKTPTESMQMSRLENDYVFRPWDPSKTEESED